MRSIVMFNRVTADGYFTSPKGGLEWVVPDPKIDQDAAEAIGRGETDTILFGRRTYEMFEKFWPHALDEPASAADPHGGKRTPEMRAMAVMLNESTKLVFSKSLKKVTWKNSRLVPRFDPKEIEALKRGPGKGIMIFGSGTIVSLLTEHGLIDEYRFVVCPVFLGDGRPLISGLKESSKLKLEECRQYPTGNLMLRYALAG